MVVDRNRTKEDFTIDGQQIEEVSQFEYLGSMINNIGDGTVKIGNRKVNSTVYAKHLEESWDFHQPESVPSKCCCHLDGHLYGCESWAMTKNDRKRVDAFEMWCYRRLLQTTWKDKRTNTCILERIGTDLHLRSGIMKRKYRCFGHIVRRDGGIEKQILQGAVKEKRGKGRQSTSWTDDMKKKLSGDGVHGASRLAADRDGWRTLLNYHSSAKSAI